MAYDCERCNLLAEELSAAKRRAAVRGVLIGMALAVIVAALTACGSPDTPAELYTPSPAQDFLPVPRPPSTPQPVYPADPAQPACDASRRSSHDLAGVCRRSPATMGALEAA